MKGLQQFLDVDRQRAWLEGEAYLTDCGDGRDPPDQQCIEQRLKYAARLEKLLRKPQAEDVLRILRTYAETCIPIPRRTERHYWSVSCLPSTSDKPLARVNASWMELFTLLSDGDGIRARIIVHSADFTIAGSGGQIDDALVEDCAERAEDVSHVLWNKPEILIIKIRGAASIRQFLGMPHALRAIRTFNLTHMNRGRNAYQSSHCYGLADLMMRE